MTNSELVGVHTAGLKNDNKISWLCKSGLSFFLKLTASFFVELKQAHISENVTALSLWKREPAIWYKEIVKHNQCDREHYAVVSISQESQASADCMNNVLNFWI